VTTRLAFRRHDYFLRPATMTPPRLPAQPTATRGSLSARQWQDLRQAARLARSEGVTVTWRRDGSITFAPLNDSPNARGNPQHKGEKSKETTHDSGATQSMDTVDNGRAEKLSKKQQRDANRAVEHRARMASPAMVCTMATMARWKLLVQRQLWWDRKDTVNNFWTSYRRSLEEARLEARRKLRGLLWREWTRPLIEPPPSPRILPGCTAISTGLQVLGMRSLRDEYIRARVRAFIYHPSIRSHRASGTSKALWAWLGFRRAMDFDRTYTAARSREMAGLIAPTSNRSRKKTSGGQRS